MAAHICTFTQLDNSDYRKCAMQEHRGRLANTGQLGYYTPTPGFFQQVEHISALTMQFCKSSEIDVSFPILVDYYTLQTF